MKNPIQIILLTAFVFQSLNCGSQTENGLFFQTLKGIAQYSNSNGEFNGAETARIANSTYDLVFGNHDSLPLIQKIDLLLILIKHQEHGTRDLRNKVFHAYIDEKPGFKADPYLIGPLIQCFYCKDSSIAVKFWKDFGSLALDNTSLSKEYRTFYFYLFKDIEQIALGTSSVNRLKRNPMYSPQSRELLKYIESKYPQYVF